MANLLTNVAQACADLTNIKNAIEDAGIAVAPGTSSSEYAGLIGNIKNSMLEYHPEATVSGSYISLDDVSELPHEVKCKISGVDDPTIVAVTKCRKNILKTTLTSRTQNGVTYTINDDGSITANGTAERTTYNTVGVLSLAEGVTYRVSGCPSGGGGKSYMLYAQNKTTYTDYYDSGSGKSFNSKGGRHEVLMVVYSGAVLENITFYPMLVVGEVSGEYEPYMAQTYTPQADGTVEGMTSASPIMNIFTDNENVNIEATYRKSKGMQTEYDRFWDAFQDNGNRVKYSTAFGGIGWTDALFKPKYNINPTDTYMMFRNTQIIDLSNLDVILDFSKSTNMQYMFQMAKTRHIGVVDMSSVTTQTHSMFYYADELHTIDKIIAAEKNVFDNGSFNGCSQLANITFEGVIASAINFQWCPLTKASITSVIEHLSDTKTGLTATFNKTAKEAAFTDEEWNALINTKTNWTISLV